MNPLTLAPEAIPDLISRLTPRQLEVVGLLAQGLGNKQTATILSISWRTVRTHIQEACKRLGVDNRTQLIVVFAMWKADNRNENI